MADDDFMTYLRRQGENTIQRFNLAARSLQPPQGWMPTAEVARLMTSPRPMSWSLTNPGSLA
jgi:hypothetical protein